MNRKAIPLVFKLKGYKIVEDASVVVDKTVLYGPNGGGKSAIMEALYATLTGDARKMDVVAIRDSFEIDIYLQKEREKISMAKKGREFVVMTDDKVIETSSDMAKAFEILSREISKLIDVPKRLIWIDACRGEGVFSIDVCEPHMDFSELEPSQLVKLEDYAGYLIGFSRLRYARGSWWVESGDEWIQVNSLAYGYRRVLAIVASLIVADAVLIEAFEAGFHADLTLELLRLITKWFNDKVVVIETHHGAAVALSLAEKWRGFYLENGRVVREINSPEDLRRADLYAKELEVYSRYIDFGG